MIKILIIIVLAVILILKFIAFRKRVIQGKTKKIKIPEEEYNRLRYLCKICLEKADKEGIRIPSKNAVAISLNDDQYTWVIIKLGLKDKEIFRCRMTLEDLAAASKFASELTKK